VTGCYECGDEPYGSGGTELNIESPVTQKNFSSYFSAA
jgi:hypothetical protein